MHGKGKAGRLKSLGSAGLSNSDKLGAKAMVSSCLVPGAGMTWGRGSNRYEGGWRLTLGSAHLHRKGEFQAADLQEKGRWFGQWFGHD